MEDRFLLISDVDGTLLGDDQALQNFCAWCEPRRDKLQLVYNSGRLFDSVVDSVSSTDLPTPDAIIGGVGTQIVAYESRKPIGGWLTDCGGWKRERILSVLDEFPDVKLQPAEFLAKFKISYFLHDASAELLEQIKQRLHAAECQVQLVYSSNRDLDVLPRGVDKGAAAAFLANEWNYPAARVIVSGDSGNDLAMFQTGFRGIVVGNAHPELKRLDSADVFLADASYAAGVLQGLQHWMTDNSAVSRQTS